MASKIRAKLVLGDEYLKKKPIVPSLRDYFTGFKETYLQMAVRERTREMYENSFDNHILEELGDLDLDQIDKLKVKEFIASLVAKKLKRPTIRIIMSHLSCCLNHAIEDELIDKNPVKGSHRLYKNAGVRTEEIEPLTEKEVTKFLKKARKRSFKYYTLFLCAIHTGMRSGELAGLKWGDIDFSSRFLTVRRSINRQGREIPTKTEQVRRIDLSKSLVEAFTQLRRITREEYLKKSKNTIPEWVFANQAGKAADMQNVINRHFKKSLENAKIREIRFHDLRHTFATLLIQNGEPIAYVQKQLGHSSVKLTIDTYTHWMPSVNREAMDKLPTIGNRTLSAPKAVKA